MDYRVRTMGEAKQVQELANVIIRASPSGGHVRVGDIATVSDTFEEEQTRSRFNGKLSATLTVAKKQDGHSISIIKDIKAEGYKKVQVQIQGDELRVTAPSRDTLQEIIALTKGKDYGVELRFGNYR